MKAWWSKLQAREQRALTIAALMITLLLTYLIIIQPFSSHLQNRRITVQNQNALIAWMEQSVSEIQRLKKTTHEPQVITIESMPRIVEASLKTSTLNKYIDVMSQTTNQKIKINFKAVPFDKLMTWLNGLWKNYEIGTEQITLTPIQTPGLVRVDILLALNADS